MRVSTNTLPNNLIDQLGILTSRQARLQQQVSTGQSLLDISDNPGATKQVLDLQTASASNAQYQQNVGTLTQLATSSMTAIKGLNTISDRAGEIATLADGLKSPDQLKAYADEVGQLIQQAVGLANTKNGDAYLFSGTNSGTPPVATTVDANGAVTAVTYQGNAGSTPIEIGAGSTMTVVPPASNPTGSGSQGLLSDSRNGSDLLNHLISLQNHLLAGDTDSIASVDRDGLDKDNTNLINQLGSNSSLQGRLETATQSLQNQSTALQTSISQKADADLPTTYLQLSETQNAYQAALQSGSMLLNQSLLTYLH